MSDRVCVLAAKVLLALVAAGVCAGSAFAQGQRKEIEAKKAIRNADPSLFAVVTPGTSFTYRISLKKGYTFSTANNDGIVVTRSRGNLVVGDARRVSARTFELDFSSANTGIGGSATVQINVTTSKGRLRFVRGAVTFALPGGNEVVTISGVDKTITARLPVGVRPTGIDTAATGSENFKTGFVCNSGSNTVTAIDLPTNTVAATIPTGSQPSYVAVAGILGQQKAYVTNAGSNDVTVIDAQTFAVVATIPVGHTPQGIAVAGQPAFDETVYVANQSDDTLSLIDVLTDTVVQTVPIGDGPTGVAVTGPIGLQTIAVTEANANTLTLLDVNTSDVVADVRVGQRPVAVIVGGSARNLFYVVNQGSGSVSYVDINSVAETKRVPVGALPSAVTTASASGLEEIYVANAGDGTVSVIEAPRATVSFVVPVGGHPRGLATIGPASLPSILVSN